MTEKRCKGGEPGSARQRAERAARDGACGSKRPAERLTREGEKKRGHGLPVVPDAAKRRSGTVRWRTAENDPGSRRASRGLAGMTEMKKAPDDAGAFRSTCVARY